jgi:hypothetical protein
MVTTYYNSSVIGLYMIVVIMKFQTLLIAIAGSSNRLDSIFIKKIDTNIKKVF